MFFNLILTAGKEKKMRSTLRVLSLILVSPRRKGKGKI